MVHGKLSVCCMLVIFGPILVHLIPCFFSAVWCHLIDRDFVKRPWMGCYALSSGIWWSIIMRTREINDTDGIPELTQAKQELIWRTEFDSTTSSKGPLLLCFNAMTLTATIRSKNSSTSNSCPTFGWEAPDGGISTTNVIAQVVSPQAWRSLTPTPSIWP